MWELDYKESWAQHWIDAFELWCWKRLLRVPWTARRSNQLTLKEISHEYSLERLVLKLKLQYFGHLMRRTDSLEKALMLWKIEEGRRRGWQGWDDWIVSLFWCTWVWASLACCSPWGHKESVTTELLKWTEWCIWTSFWKSSPPVEIHFK